jgi:hypothetical protein
MSHYAPQNLAELQAAISHGAPLTAGRFKNLRADTISVCSPESQFADLVGPMADDIRQDAAEYHAEYMATGSRHRNRGAVVYYVSAWMSSRWGTGWHPFAILQCHGMTWSTTEWSGACSSISGLTPRRYRAACAGIKAFADTLAARGETNESWH